jgi:hypothetical protein
MKRNILIIGIVLLLGLFTVTACAQASAAAQGPTSTDWPTDEDPGPPFYARTYHAPPFVFNDGAWGAILFYRDPECVPEDFNLVQFFDAPTAFDCELNSQGFSLWQREAMSGAPKITTTTGNGAVPVWFVPVEALNGVTQDGDLTIGELEGLDVLLVGHADLFEETLQPHSLPPDMGGGGHPIPKLILNAHGQLEDGRQFSLHITQVQDEVKAIQIQFR